MRKIPRRTVLGWGVGLAAGRALSQAAKFEPVFKPEKDAALRLLRWSGFVKSDEELWNANTKKFTELTGVPVSVEYITWEDVRPKAALAANLGTGPDIIMGWYDDPHIYPQKLVDVTDVAEGLGKQLGGWYDVAHTYGYSNRMKHWIAVPVGGTVECLTYRTSWMKEAGFDEFPKLPTDLLKLARALKAKGHPVGFALGHAVGDGNNWTHWVLWTFGGKAIEKDNKTIAIAQKPSLDAIVYAQELYAQMVPGVGSWLDPNNNRAFLAGEISLTNNGISIYYAAKKDFPQIAEDIGHSPFPIGPVGRATELANFSQAFIFKHSRFPNAAKEYIRFMLSPDQAAPWVDAMNGYVTPALKQYKDLPVWTKDPKATPFRDGIARMQHNGYAGEPGQQAAAALAEFIVLDMFADATVNGMSAKDAAARAENRLRRIYRG
ncbi:MAG: extracellular solute-binding protein [Deltaproteobacteria bacterium]|nr:MAG: extracellular solute-binding protein [Deltaproteobacteria bacterium]